MWGSRARVKCRILTGRMIDSDRVTQANCVSGSHNGMGTKKNRSVVVVGKIWKYEIDAKTIKKRNGRERVLRNN